MKNLLFTLFLTAGLFSVAQESLTEGKIVLKQKMTSDNPQLSSQLASMGEMSTTTYFKGNKSRTEMSNPMSGNNITIVDNDAKKSVVLMDNPYAGKMFQELDLNVPDEELEKIKSEKLDETKTILGYKCQAYKLTMTQQGQEMAVKLFSAERLNVAMDKSKFGKLIKGFPLAMEITVSQMGSTMTITSEAVSVDKDTVSDDMFSLNIPEGYKKMPTPPTMN